MWVPDLESLGIMERRRRRRSQLFASGSITYTDYWGTTYDIAGPWSTEIVGQDTIDYIGKSQDKWGLLPASPFSSYHIERKWTGVSGRSFFKINDVPPDRCSFSTPEADIPPGYDNGNDVYAVQLLSQTNPFRTEYSAIVGLRELADLTSMFALAAKSFLEYVGQSYLNYRFGWVAFVQDVRKLHSITSSIERRLLEFSSLVQNGGLKRNIWLDSYGQSYSTDGVIFHSTYGALVIGRESYSISTTVRGSVSWRPTDDFVIPLDGLTSFNAAVQATLDLDELDAQTAWELIPFSWLADYFVKVSDSFGAMLGQGLIEPHDVCIMRKHTIRVSGVPTDHAENIHGGDYTIDVTYNTRDVVSSVDFPPLNFSLLTQGQFLVIAALLAKFRG